jgi:tRNA A-37 threonylcarbamoyl transferase component Bud32
VAQRRAPADAPDPAISVGPLGDQPTTPHRLAAPELLPAPADFGRYHLLRELAHGGMGVVYLAHDPTLGRQVALKMIRSGALARFEEVERFQREARAAAQLHHPNVVPIHEVGEHDGRHYFTMEYVDGGSLAEHRDRLAGDPRAAVTLLEKVARAVHAAHEKGVLHRDLKPANVLLDDRGEPRVTDFGLAKLLDEDVELTHSGDVLGTPAYMAPEQAAGQLSRVGPTCDVWSLGVMLYELLTGQRPFSGSSRAETTRRIREDDPARPRSVRPRLPRDLETICLKCLEKGPEQRYPTAAELADDLARWLRDEPIRARPASRLRLAARAVRRHPTLSATTALLAGFLVVLVLLNRGRPVPVELREAELTEGWKRLHRQLLESKSVVLLDSEGRLTVAGRSRVPRGVTLSIAQGPPVRLTQNDGFGMLELLPDPPCPSYTIRGWVKHDAGQDRSEAGLCFLLGEREMVQGREHVFGTLTCAEHGDSAQALDPQGNMLRMTYLALRRDFESGPLRMNRWFVAKQGAARGQVEWRQFKIVVRPERIEAYEGEQWLGLWDRDQVAKKVQDGLADFAQAAQAKEKVKELVSDWDDARAGFRPLALRESIGLYVRNGSGSFRDLVVEPLAEASAGKDGRPREDRP